MSEADDLFESPEHLILWAYEEIKELDIVAKDVLSDGKFYAIVVEEDAERRNKVVKVKQIKPLPASLRGKTANIIKNLRDALDQASAAASELVSGKGSNRTHFPFGESPSDLEQSLSQRKAFQCKGIPESLYPAFRSLEPYPTSDSYPGGDDILRTLARVSGPNKHKITIGISTVRPVYSIGGTISFRSSGQVHKPKWDSRKNEMKLLTIGPGGEAQVDLGVPLQISFDSPHLRGHSVAEFLTNALGRVRNAVESLRMEAERLSS